MKQLYTLAFLLLFSGALFAQVPNYSHTDCNGMTRTVWGELQSGKPLLVASHGLDCSICASQAGSMQNWAAANSSVNVWGAMVRLYSGTADCGQVNNWNNTHNWNDVWSFVDSNEDWLNVGAPRYYVINPMDSTLAYEGTSFAQASSTALSLVNSVGIDEEEPLKFALTKNRIVISDIQSDATITIHDLTGRTLFETNVRTGGSQEFYFNNSLHSGIYLVTTHSNGKASTLKISL
jgi:hypothetical protein